MCALIPFVPSCSGIGIVNATEVLNAFPEEDGLQKFREWIESPDPTILGKASSTRKRGSNSSVEEASTVNQGAISSDDDIDRMKQIFMDKHVRTNLRLSSFSFRKLFP